MDNTVLQMTQYYHTVLLLYTAIDNEGTQGKYGDIAMVRNRRSPQCLLQDTRIAFPYLVFIEGRHDTTPSNASSHATLASLLLFMSMCGAISVRSKAQLHCHPKGVIGGGGHLPVINSDS